MCGSIPCVLKLVDEPGVQRVDSYSTARHDGDEEGDGDERDGEVTGKESDSGARDGGGGGGMGGGVLGN